MGSLEEDLHQKEFTSQRMKLLINVMYTGSWLNTLQNRLFRQYDITPQQFNLMRILRGRYPEPASINLLIDRMIDKMSNASRLVDKLEKKAYATRKSCPRDRRQVEVSITEKGLEVLARLDIALAGLEKELSTISEEEAAAANQVLDKWRG